jgi:hypothetical protein
MLFCRLLIAELADGFCRIEGHCHNLTQVSQLGCGQHCQVQRDWPSKVILLDDQPDRRARLGLWFVLDTLIKVVRYRLAFVLVAEHGNKAPADPCPSDTVRAELIASLEPLLSGGGIIRHAYLQGELLLPTSGIRSSLQSSLVPLWQNMHLPVTLTQTISALCICALFMFFSHSR